MALKGSAVIELTDTNTGQKEVIRHDNLVTNAINDILSVDPLNMKLGSELDQRSVFFPVVSNLIGGIVLFQEALDEDPDKYFAPESNALVGYSNMEVSPNTDARRGSLNQIESGPLEDGTGYRFAFDFANTQGNGVISALALTSQSMGGCGYGSEVFNNYAMTNVNTETSPSVAFRRIASTAVRTNVTADKARRIADITSFDVSSASAYAVEPTAVNTLTVHKYNLLTDNVGLLTENLLREVEPEIIAEIKTSSFLPKYLTGTSSNYVGFCDGGDGFIWGFQLANNASYGDTVLWIKIRKSDWSFTEGTWTLPQQVRSPGVWREATGSNTLNITRCLVHNGLAYFDMYTSYGVLIVNVDNPTDTTVVPTERTSDMYATSANRSLFGVMGDVVVFPGGYIANRVYHPGYALVTINPNVYPYGLYRAGRPNIRFGPFVFTVNGGENDYASFYMLLDSSYLATINNLDTPVTKTADKTMKITYILREE